MPRSDEREALIEVMKAIDDASDMTQDEWSRRCGKAKNYINKIIKGRRRVYYDEIRIIAEAAGLTEPEFLARIWAARDRKAKAER